ncbi:hypothetical protein LV89_04965 [Arcicella aurantiaca]|uniref:Uncharacterized protein n=1 Tax=Arcicella aurantiaca TaxID=591202 RepID=A0A316DCS3_9BACT|nr:hypothetical protein [Arcicella aurantiaca]PWK15755.1 hypothetical protein LV89_04965 [Arcicella aurantiaca]
MTFFITSESSYEVPNLKTVEFEDELNSFFLEKNYGDSITHISTIIICVSDKFEQFHPVRKARLAKDRAKLGFEYKLDFNTYQTMDKEQQIKYIENEYLKSIKEIFENKKIKNFDDKTFLCDLDSFLNKEENVS